MFVFEAKIQFNISFKIPSIQKSVQKCQKSNFTKAVRVVLFPAARSPMHKSVLNAATGRTWA